MGAATFSRTRGAFADDIDGEQSEDTYKKYRVVRGTITMSASYATGGDTLALGPVGLKEARWILTDPRFGLNTSGLSITIDASVPTAPKVLAYDANDTEVPNATNLSARRAIPVWIMGVG